MLDIYGTKFLIEHLVMYTHLQSSLLHSTPGDIHTYLVLYTSWDSDSCHNKLNMFIKLIMWFCVYFGDKILYRHYTGGNEAYNIMFHSPSLENQLK